MCLHRNKHADTDSVRVRLWMRSAHAHAHETHIEQFCHGVPCNLLLWLWLVLANWQLSWNPKWNNNTVNKIDSTNTTGKTDALEHIGGYQVNQDSTGVGHCTGSFSHGWCTLQVCFVLFKWVLKSLKVHLEPWESLDQVYPKQRPYPKRLIRCRYESIKRKISEHHTTLTQMGDGLCTMGLSDVVPSKLSHWMNNGIRKCCQWNYTSWKGPHPYDWPPYYDQPLRVWLTEHLNRINRSNKNAINGVTEHGIARYHGGTLLEWTTTFPHGLPSRQYLKCHSPRQPWCITMYDKLTGTIFCCCWFWPKLKSHIIWVKAYA